jgi:hypothetical protein
MAENEIGKKNTIMEALAIIIYDLNARLEKTTTSNLEKKQRMEEMVFRLGCIILI